MALINERPFYFSTIRRITAAVGTVFDNISIVRKDTPTSKEVIRKVPIGYGSKQHYFMRMDSGISTKPGDIQVNTVSPLIGYVMTGISRDPSRSLNRLNLRKKEIHIGPNNEKLRYNQLMSVPFNLEYSLSVFAKNMDDGLQIIEQFVPYFSPSINLRVKEIPEMDIWNDVQLTMADSIGVNDSFETGFTDRRELTWDFTITAKTNLYMPITEQKVIMKSIVDIDNFNPLYNLEIMTVTPLPGEFVNKNNSTVEIELNG
jgi:hypothetical protein